MDIGVVEIVNWVTLIFPSFTQYAKIVAPLLIFTLSVVGVFFNILPEPHHSYPIPCIKDLEREIKSRSRMLYLFTRISRRMTIVVNTVVGSRTYAWFYKVTNKIAEFVLYVRGGPSEKNDIVITEPEHYNIKFDDLFERHHDNDK